MVFGYSVAQVKKFLTAVTGLVALFVAQGFLSAEVENWVSGVVAFVTAVLVFVVKNEELDPDELVALRAERDRLNKANPDRYNSGDAASRNPAPGGLVVGPTAPGNQPVNTGAGDVEDDEPPHGPRYV